MKVYIWNGKNTQHFPLAETRVRGRFSSISGAYGAEKFMFADRVQIPFPLFRTSLPSLIRAQHFLDVFLARSICDARRCCFKIMTRCKINRAAAEMDFSSSRTRTRCDEKAKRANKIFLPLCAATFVKRLQHSSSFFLSVESRELKLIRNVFFWLP